MDLAIALQWDRKQLQALRAQNLERAITKTMRWAGRDAIRAVKASGSKGVRAKKRMKAGRVNASLVLTFPKGAKHIDDMAWRMDVSGKPIPLVDFPNRQTKKGVSVAVNRGRRVLVVSAFRATMKSGHTGIFRRQGEKRLPIDELFSTRVSDVFLDGGFVPALLARGQLVFNATFNRVLPLELEKLKR